MISRYTTDTCQITGEFEIETKLNQIIANISSQSTIMTPFGKSIAENGFTTMVKYLTFAACAARVPVTQSLTKEINERVLIAGSPENIELDVLDCATSYFLCQCHFTTKSPTSWRKWSW